MKSVFGAVLIACACATPISAASISYQTFDYATYKAQVAEAAAYEDFESPSSLTYAFEGSGIGNGTAPHRYGELAGSIGTSVGTFSTHGSGVGSGSTCRGHDIDAVGCSSIALQNHTMNGQGNVLDAGGQWALNSNDTLGMIWDVVLPDNAMFDSLVFAIRDAADQGAALSVMVDGVTEVFSNAANNNVQLWRIDFDAPVNSAQVLLANSKTNDAFTIDGAAVMLSAVPLPAPALMLLSAFGMTACMARRRRRAA